MFCDILKLNIAVYNYFCLKVSIKAFTEGVISSLFLIFISLYDIHIFKIIAILKQRAQDRANARSCLMSHNDTRKRMIPYRILRSLGSSVWAAAQEPRLLTVATSEEVYGERRTFHYIYWCQPHVRYMYTGVSTVV